MQTYRADPDRGCGWLIAGAAMLLGTILTGVIFGLDAWQLVFILVAAFVVYWLLTQLSRR